VPEPAGCVAAAAMLREAPAADAVAVSQLLHGEGFAVLDIADGWAWGYGLHDHYVGYVPADALGAPLAASHIVDVPNAPVFATADIKAPVVAFWPIGARFASDGETGDFIATADGYVHARHARPIAAPEQDPVAVAERLIATPYLWGGRGGAGIDCSGLVQVALGLCGIVAPRDSDQQQALGAALDADAPLRRGDLLFFPGHVGLMVDAETMIHANAHWMAVTVEPLADVVARLRPAHAEPVIARKRIDR